MEWSLRLMFACMIGNIIEDVRGAICDGYVGGWPWFGLGFFGFCPKMIEGRGAPVVGI